MGVSRQTVSRWESDEIIPELNKLIDMGNLFSCKPDALIPEDLTAGSEIYSPVEIRTIPVFTLARYMMVTPNPEDDVKTT